MRRRPPAPRRPLCSVIRQSRARVPAPAPHGRNASELGHRRSQRSTALLERRPRARAASRGAARPARRRPCRGRARARTGRRPPRSVSRLRRAPDPARSRPPARSPRPHAASTATANSRRRRSPSASSSRVRVGEPREPPPDHVARRRAAHGHRPGVSRARSVVSLCCSRASSPTKNGLPSERAWTLVPPSRARSQAGRVRDEQPDLRALSPPGRCAATRLPCERGEHVVHEAPCRRRRPCGM